MKNEGEDVESYGNIKTEDIESYGIKGEDVESYKSIKTEDIDSYEKNKEKGRWVL